MKCFNGFCKEGVVHADTVGEILQMMGLRVKKEALQAIIDEVDEDGKERCYINLIDPVSKFWFLQTNTVHDVLINFPLV